MEPVGERAAEDEASRLGAQDDVRLERPRELLQPVDRLAEVRRVGDERHQVLEDDPGLGEVRDVADAVAQVERSPRGHVATLPLGEESQLTPEEEPRELLRRLGERLQVLEAGLAPLGVARSERGRDELLEQARLAPGRVAEGPQMPRVDPVLGELPAGGRDLRVAFAIEALPALDARREQAVLLERPRERRIDAGALAELRQVELALLLAERRSGGVACAPRRRCRRRAPA